MGDDDLHFIYIYTVKKNWTEVQKDCQARKLNREDAMDRSRWRKLIKDD